MARYSIERCPHCKAKLYSGLANHYNYGSPLRTCPSCRNVYIDCSYKELALDTYQKYKPRKLEGFTVACLILDVIMIFAWLYIGTGFWDSFYTLFSENMAPFSIATLVMTIGTVLFTVDNLCSYEKRLKEYNVALSASQKRMENPVYASMLEKASYHCE